MREEEKIVMVRTVIASRLNEMDEEVVTASSVIGGTSSFLVEALTRSFHEDTTVMQKVDAAEDFIVALRKDIMCALINNGGKK